MQPRKITGSDNTVWSYFKPVSTRTRSFDRITGRPTSPEKNRYELNLHILDGVKEHEEYLNWSFKLLMPIPVAAAILKVTQTHQSINGCDDQSAIKMDSENVITAASLADDLVVEILSRVPVKSFCRFRCVCKAWLAFSSDPHYCQKLPKIPGLLHEGRPGMSAIQLVSLYPNDKQIDGALTFVPQHEQLELVDCCNGLVLCQYKTTYSSPPDTCSFIVCNPATREWRTLPIPESHTHPHGRIPCRFTAFLAFDPSWSAQFYVLNFQEKTRNCWPTGTIKLEVFSSDLSAWLVYEEWVRNHKNEIFVQKPHKFTGGVLHMEISNCDILVVEGLEAMSSGVAPHHSIIEPSKVFWDSRGGCFDQSSSGLLQYAFPEENFRTIEVFSLDACHPGKWSLKHRLSMQDAFGRDCLPVALDLERGVLFLFETMPKKLWSYDIDTGKHHEVKHGRLNWSWDYHYYVACYSKLPG
ncbi:hypothetical protein ACQ4PT_060382 [Festuca glaucescens]